MVNAQPGATVSGICPGGIVRRRNERGPPFLSCTVPWASLESAEEVELNEPYHVALADGLISLAKEVVFYGLDDLVLLDLAVAVGIVPVNQGVPGGLGGRQVQLGAKLVQFGTPEGSSREDLEKAIGPNTAAVHYYAVAQEPDPQALSLEDTIEIAHAKDVPVLVDAAGQIYPLDLFGSYVRMGADFQCTAAKYLGSSIPFGICEDGS